MKRLRVRATRGLLLGALGLHFATSASAFAEAHSREFLCQEAPRGATLQSLPQPQSIARRGPGFVLLPEATPSVACLNRGLADDALAEQVAMAELNLSLDVELAVVLTTDPIGCSPLFYIPVENDIRGIGYAKSNGAEVFDHEPSTKLQGIAFLNDIPYWETYPEEFRTAFLHEVGHRWGARIGARRDGTFYDLTGRQGGHWSYFLDSAGSPLEGNQFGPNSAFETQTEALRLSYSALDLYLMGALPPAEVGAVRYLDNASAPGLDCDGKNVTAASPPQICQSKRLSGEWKTLAVADVIENEGPRIPAFDSAPRRLTVGVFVLGGAQTSWSRKSCRWLEDAVKDRLADFARATGERMELVNAVGEGDSCSVLVQDVDETAQWAPSGGCSAVDARFIRGWRSWPLVVVVATLFVRRRRAPRRLVTPDS